MFLDLGGEGPLYQRLYRELRRAVLNGRLRPGERLPSSRSLAATLAISRNVVLLAFEQLMTEGYLEARIGSGTFVASELPADLSRGYGDREESGAADPRAEPVLSRYGSRLEAAGVKLAGGPATRSRLPFDFRREVQPTDELPLEVWRRLVSRRLGEWSSSRVDYAPPSGFPPLRTALADYLRRARGVSCEPDRIVVTGGSQQGLDLIARLLLDPGDRLALEDPHYPRARQCFAVHGAELVPIGVDGQGLDVEELRRAGAGAKLVYVTPSHQFPTGAVLPLGRRLALLEWASENGAFVIEDDYDSEFRYQGRPVEAIQGLDRAGRVLYVGSFSKSLFPALRIGYLVLPPSLVKPLAAAKLLCDRHSPTFEQQVLADFVAEGHFERHLRRAVARCGRRRAVLVEAIRRHLGDRVELAGTASGLHALLWLNGIPPGAAAEIVARAAKAGVGVYSVAFHHLRPPSRAGLLLRYVSLSEDEIRGGIERLAQVLAG